MEEQAKNNGQEETGAVEAAPETPKVTPPDLPAEGLQQRLQQIEQENASFKDQYLRSVAELRNYKRRVEQDRVELIRNAGAGVLLKLLPVLDDFDLAMAHVPAEIAASPWFNGIKLVQSKLQTLLESE